MQLNKCLFIGRATRDPETKYLPSGQAVTSLAVAVNESFKDKAGEWKEECTFIDVTLWGKTAEKCAETVRKGTMIFCDGKLKQEQWEKDGQKHSKLKVTATQFIICQAGGRGEDNGNKAVAPARGENPASDNLDFEPTTTTRDSIPF